VNFSDQFAQRGMRPMARLALFLALVAVLWTIKNILLEQLHALIMDRSSPYFLLIEESAEFAVVYAASLVLSRLERVPPRTYGLPLNRALGKLFWQGAAIGLCEISLLVGLIFAFGGYSAGSLALHGPRILYWALIWGAVFLFVALFEEFAFRGYLLHTLAQSIGFWPAAIILALGFGILHRFNQGENLAGVAGVIAIALVFALTLRRTGTLWLAVGWHAAYDFGETFLFSVPDSGGMFSHHLSNATLQGPVWLTGGTVGPEGSIFGFLLMGVLALVFHFLYPSQTPVLGSAPVAAPPSASVD
jgi:uncharacterized protein